MYQNKWVYRISAFFFIFAAESNISSAINSAFADGMVSIPPAAALMDTFNNVWTISEGSVLANGSISAAFNAANIIQLAYVNGTLYALNNADSWWVWTGTGWLSTTVPTNFSIGAVSGSCGIANGVSTTTPPTTNLCARGTANSQAGDGPWTWECGGETGGISAFCSTISFGSTYYIDPSESNIGDGSQASPFNDWMSVSFSAGDTYLQKAGTIYDGSLAISGVNGTAKSPIIIGSYGSGEAPTINSVVIYESSFVTVQGFTVSNGINISDARPVSNVSILSNTITSKKSYGVYDDGLGTGDIISSNIISNVGTFGIMFGGNGVSVSYNSINESGADGIMCLCVNSSIKNNVVNGSGQSVSGASGIHLFGANDGSEPWPDVTYGNVIQGNVVYNSQDSTTDGDGILLDQNTHDNVVTSNLIFWNSGQGIYIYDSWNNQVSGNTLFNNGIGTGKILAGNITLSASLEHYWGFGNSIFQNSILVSNVDATPAYGPFGFEVTPWILPGSNNFWDNNLNITSLAGTQEEYYRVWGQPSVGSWVAGNSVDYWNGYPNHIYLDGFGSQIVSNIANSGLLMQFIIPQHYQISAQINGELTTLYGWRRDTGLYGKW